MHPIHNHSEYSALDGYSKVTEIANRIESLGMPGAFLTDHAVIGGWRSFRDAMKKKGLFAGFGVEAYQTAFANRAMRPEKGNKSQDSFHLLLLAQNEKGVRNIYRLSDAAARTGFYYKPRVDWELLEQHSEGIIATSACMGGLVANGVMNDDLNSFYKYLKIFKDKFFIELHTYDSPDQRELNKALVSLATTHGVPLIYANDAHYATPESYGYHEVLLCMQMHNKLNDPDRMSHPPCLYIMGEDDVRKRLDHLAPARVDEAIRNSDLIADMCKDAVLPERGKHLPTFVPREATEENNTQVFLRKVQEGLEAKYGVDYSDAVDERAVREAETIMGAGLVDYFLITADICEWADKNGIERGPGRGSAGGSIVANALNITDVDPLKYGLFFERFYNVGRDEGLPDIDLDVEKRGRPMILDYLRERYGTYNVIPIANHIRMKPLDVVDRIGNVLGIEYGETNKIKKIIERVPDIGITSADQIAWKGGPGIKVAVLDHEPTAEALAPYMEKYPDLFDIAMNVGGRLRSYGTHASAIIISDVDTRDWLPAMMAAPEGEDGKKLKDKEPTTQIEMREVEKLGFLKEDILGLRTLDTMRALSDLIGNRDYKGTDFEDQPEEFWQLMDKGRGVGLFQVEDGMAKSIGKRLKPRNLTDLAAIVSLNRPGPLRSGVVDRYIARRSGDEVVSFPDELLSNILAETYGDFLYQEQVIQYAGLIGYDPKEADWIRKMLGKKLMAEMDAEMPRYLERASKHMEATVAQTIWDSIVDFSKYSFNKSHAIAYGKILAWTIWAKFYYPAEYIMALIQTNPGKKGDYIGEGRILGVNVNPPDVNISEVDISTKGGDIYFGLSNIKNVGVAARWVVDHRPYTSVLDFRNKLELAQQEWEDGNKKGKSARQTVRANVIEALINGGAFDTIEPRDITDQERAKLEEDLLGFTLTDTSAEIIDANQDLLTGLDDFEDLDNPVYRGDQLKVPGVLKSIKKIKTKTGKDMAFAKIEWEGNEAEFSIFGDKLPRYTFMLNPNTVAIWKLKPTERGINLESAQKLVAHG